MKVKGNFPWNVKKQFAPDPQPLTVTAAGGVDSAVLSVTSLGWHSGFHRVAFNTCLWDH